MTIQECYKEMGGDFEGVQKRFGGVALVEKFAIKFLSDSSFQDLEDGLKEKDAEMIDPLIFFASSMDKAVFPTAVGPVKMTIGLFSVIIFIRFS